MSALEKPTPESYEFDISPAEPAGDFLYEKYPVGLDTGNNIFEATARIQTMERAGRLMGIRALPGEVTLVIAPEPEEVIQ